MDELNDSADLLRFQYMRSALILSGCRLNPWELDNEEVLVSYAAIKAPKPCAAFQDWVKNLSSLSTETSKGSESGSDSGSGPTEIPIPVPQSNDEWFQLLKERAALNIRDISAGLFTDLEVPKNA